ncbi:MAG: hypothetical protein M1819_004176 [Sarea resinae]|nr:MAG: hypothetical protein M1819_004176 [Sarea resinae]
MSLLREAKRVAAEFDYPAEEVRKSVQEFLVQMDEGLQKPGQTLNQIPTYVTAVPNGTEKGVYLAVDLGGTNFRVCSVRLHGNTTFSMAQTKVAIPRELMVAETAEELFAFLAKQIEKFIQVHHSDHFEAHVRRRQTMSEPEGYKEEQIFSLGFTFSFPINQIGINRGTLIRWTKGFNIKDAIGKDVCALLQTEIDKLRLPVKVAALVNDTVGTLMARSYTSPGKTGTLLGAIFGTGTNGAYMEKLDRITKLESMGGDAYDKSTGEMIVNTEWGSFDNHLKVLPSTPYDADLDRESINPGIQMFEKRVSGMFLGEILRRAILSLVNNPSIELFKDENSSENDMRSTTSIAPESPLYSMWGLDTSLLSVIRGDTSATLSVTRQALERDLLINAPSTEDAVAVKEMTVAIGRRAARLSAVPIGAIVLSSGRLGTSPSDASTTTTTTTQPPSTMSSISSSLQAGDVSAAASTAATAISSSLPSLTPPPPGHAAGTDASSSGVSEADVVDIGVDGSLVEFYPGFEDDLREALREVPGIGAAGEQRIRIGIAKDGSGVGAALIALVARKVEPPAVFEDDDEE